MQSNEGSDEKLMAWSGAPRWATRRPDPRWEGRAVCRDMPTGHGICPVAGAPAALSVQLESWGDALLHAQPSLLSAPTSAFTCCKSRLETHQQAQGLACGAGA